MLMTVAQYAESRDLSVATVKNHIKKLKLDLPENPNDRRQRFLSIDHQIALDASTRRSAPAPATPEIEIQQTVQYHRSDAVSMVLAEHSLMHSQIAPLRTVDQNPLYQALALQVQALQAQNAAQIQQIYQQGQAQREADAAIEAMDQLAIAQRATQRAAKHHHLEQDLYNQTLTQLNLASRGIQPTTPTAQPVPQSQPAASSSPDWL